MGESKPEAVDVLYSSDAEIDPYIGMFFFPQDTHKLALFDESGEILWQRNLGSKMVPVIGFSPLFAFDLDQDGIDEIYIVNNRDLDPLNFAV